MEQAGAMGDIKLVTKVELRRLNDILISKAFFHSLLMPIDLSTTHTYPVTVNSRTSNQSHAKPGIHQM